MLSFSKFAVSASLAFLMVAATPVTSFAQAPQDPNVSKLDLQDVDIREALRSLFKLVGSSYAVAPEVQGSVTVSLRDVPFSTALQNLLKQVDATYRIEGGIYLIATHEPIAPNLPPGKVPPPVTLENKTIRRARIMHADPMLVAILVGSKNGKTDFSFAPELSTVINTPTSGRGGGFGNGFGGSGRGNGNHNGGGFDPGAGSGPNRNNKGGGHEGSLPGS